MKKTLFTFLAIGLAVACADPYDDSDLQSKVNALDSRVATIENTCRDLNSTISGVSQSITNLESTYTVSAVTNTANGYTISFTNGTSVTISNGAKGEPGAPGAKGDPGAPGAAGATPAIGVVLDGGSYYWTVNGTALTDASGNKVKASADAPIAPKFRIESGNWQVSTDNGSTWQAVEGAASASSIEVTQDAENVYIKLSDGSTVTLPKAGGFKLNIAKEIVALKTNAETEIPYTVASADDHTMVFVEAGGIEAAVAATDAASGVIKVNVGAAVPEGAYIIVKAVKNTTGEASVKYVTFEELSENVLVVTTTAYEVPAEGGSVNVVATTNSACVVNIPADVTWLRYVATKATHEETLEFAVDANTGDARTATVSISSEGTEPVAVTFVQAAAPAEEEAFVGVIDSWKFTAKTSASFASQQPQWDRSLSAGSFNDPADVDKYTLMSVSGNSKAIWYCAMRPDAPKVSYFRTGFNSGPQVNGVWWGDGLKFYLNGVNAKAGQTMEFMGGVVPTGGNLPAVWGVQFSFDGGVTFTDGTTSVYKDGVRTPEDKLNATNKGHEIYSEILVPNDIKNQDVVVFMYAVPGQEYVVASSATFVMPDVDDPTCAAISSSSIRFSQVSKNHIGGSVDGPTISLR